jgi:hypothetical protein
MESYVDFEMLDNITNIERNFLSITIMKHKWSKLLDAEKNKCGDNS